MSHSSDLIYPLSVGKKIFKEFERSYPRATLISRKIAQITKKNVILYILKNDPKWSNFKKFVKFVDWFIETQKNTENWNDSTFVKYFQTFFQAEIVKSLPATNHLGLTADYEYRNLIERHIERGVEGVYD